MTKITQFNKASAGIVAERVTAALQTLAQDLGLVIKRGGGTFGDGTFTMKLEISVVGEDGKVASRAAETFKQLASLYGFKPDDLGKTFRSGGKEYTIAGLVTRKRMRPLIASCGGKEYCFAVEDVRRLMGLAVLDTAMRVRPVGE
jgi:hypothetical protein